MKIFIFWIFVFSLVFVVAFSAYKLIKFFMTEDFSPDRYTYEIKEINGEKVEYVVDKNEMV